ncbi:RAD28 (YDR030C) [Zygosaccharomyces parabailii]|nr:RAD28 (YDR030C) [Zygosaccharomyces parabailii]AQZ17668.1 RAD28 (YDR030C) [Zygosaccharomyces parabailii]CDH16164.1 related to Radiation-sensitive protein 28 [Zygosaccharomyces bailii ISA1307]
MKFVDPQPFNMNTAFLKYQLGQCSDIYNVAAQHEFESLVECEMPRRYNYSKEPRGSVSCLEIDHSGQFLLACGNDGSLGVWGLDERLDRDRGLLYCKRIKFQARKVLDEPMVRAPSMPAPQVVHSFETRRNKFRLYRQSSAEAQQIANAPVGHRYGIRSAKWYRIDNGMFFTGSNDCSLQIWDTNTFETVQSIELGHRVNQIDTDPEGEYLIVATEDGYPRLIDLRNLVTSGVTHLGQGTMPYEVLTCKCNPKRSHIIATGDSHGCVKLWDLRKRNRMLMELTHTSQGKRAHMSVCNDLAWDQAGHQLATLGTDGKLHVWAPFTTLPSRQVGPLDLPRTRHHRRTSQRLLWFDNYILCNTDYGEIQLFDACHAKLWTKIEDPDMCNKTPQFSSMAMQPNMANGKGLRLYLGTANSIYEYT